MHPRSPGRHRHWALAVLLALLLHAAPWLSWAPGPAAAQLFPLAVASIVAQTIELTLADDAEPEFPQESPWLTTSAASPRAHSRDTARAELRAATIPSPFRMDGHGATEGTTDATGLPSVERGGTPPRVIDLGLNGGVQRAALSGGWLELPSRPTRPSDGGLRQGLAALDAVRGLSRSAPAHHAAYEAARRFAPAIGMGIFDLVADERGIVLSVTLASAPADEAKWLRVGQELAQLLKERRLRVPPGARGLAARLRIETGELAKEIARRFRAKRGAALGQAALHPREMRAESTRDSLEPGHLSPTLGVTIAGGGSGPGIRVVLLDERPL
ncbi:MAG: hypothetical protein RL033_7847 [Pseudomonadota bacterium]